MRRLERLRQHLDVLVLVEFPLVRQPLIGPGFQHDIDGLMEPRRAFLAGDAERRELTAFEAAARAPVDPAAGQNVQQRHFFRQPQRVIKRRQRHGRADAQSFGPRRRHGPHHVHRRAHGKTGKVVLGEPDGVVAGLVHDGKPLERRFVNRIEWHGPVAPPEKLQNADFHDFPHCVRPDNVVSSGAKVQCRENSLVPSCINS